MQKLILVRAVRVRMTEAAARSVVSFTAARVYQDGLGQTARVFSITFIASIGNGHLYQHLKLHVTIFTSNQIASRLHLVYGLLTQSIYFTKRSLYTCRLQCILFRIIMVSSLLVIAYLHVQ